MSRTVYVGRLPRDATKADVEDHFKALGRIKEVRLMSNFGFVEFESPDDIENVCRELDGQPMMGERLIVEPSRDARRRDTFDARPPPRGGGGPRPRGVRLSVIGISEATSWQDLKDFGRNGCESVIFADIDRNTGNGVIEYPTMADAEDAIRRLDGTEIHGVPVKLEIQEGGGGAGGGGGGGGRDSWDRPPPRDYGRRYDGRDSYRPRERSRERPRYDRRDSRRDDRSRYEPRYDDDRRPRDDRFDDRAYDRERSPRRDRESPRRDRESPRRDRESPRRDRESPRRGRDSPRLDRESPPRERDDASPLPPQ